MIMSFLRFWCSYLVSSMYEEALSLASSTLKVLLENKNIISEETVDGLQFYDMMESAGMVLVQSLKGLGRYLSLITFHFLSYPYVCLYVELLGNFSYCMTTYVLYLP